METQGDALEKPQTAPQGIRLSRLIKGGTRRNAWAEYALKQKDSDMEPHQEKQDGRYTARASHRKQNGMSGK